MRNIPDEITLWIFYFFFYLGDISLVYLAEKDTTLGGGRGGGWQAPEAYLTVSPLPGQFFTF